MGAHFAPVAVEGSAAAFALDLGEPSSSEPQHQVQRRVSDIDSEPMRPRSAARGLEWLTLRACFFRQHASPNEKLANNIHGQSKRAQCMDSLGCPLKVLPIIELARVPEEQVNCNNIVKNQKPDNDWDF
jgi:hypothetical protein